MRPLKILEEHTLQCAGTYVEIVTQLQAGLEKVASIRWTKT